MTTICAGICECSEKQIIGKKFAKTVWITLKIGASKVLSTIGIAILTAIASALLLSVFIKPEPQNVMPAFYYDGTYSEYNNEEKTADVINMILEESENRIATDWETAYYDIAYAYFSSNNYDLAIEALKKCYDENPSWEYAYNIGISYGYLMDYQASVKYLNEALELNPPVYDRAGILDTITLLENYYTLWLSSLFQ